MPSRSQIAAHPLDELGRRRDEASLAELRLEDDRRHLRRRTCEVNIHSSCVERLLARRAAVVVRERRPVHLRGERAHSGLVRVHLRRHRHREQRPAVEAALERDHGRPPRREPRDLDGVLDRLGARVEERCARRACERRQLAEALGELDVAVVRDDREIGVEESGSLLLDRLDDLRVAVADVASRRRRRRSR